MDEEQDAIVTRPSKTAKSWLEVLMACPLPMDDLPPRSREHFRLRWTS
jgi:hypothetical protein